MSLSRPTAQQLVTRFACLAGAVVVLLGILAAPAMAWKGWGSPRGSSSGSAAPTAPAASPQPATSGCKDGELSQPFARFGDTAWYTPVNGGSFEQGTAGWSLSRASVAAGNESYAVVGGSHSLAIQPDGQAVSPAFCVNIEHPTLRFFARQTSGSWAVLNVVLRWTDSGGRTHDTTVGSLQSGTAWKPTPVLALGSTLPLWQSGETLSVRLVLKPEPYGGAWAVDDIFVDPRMR
jgi:hypothetical protein